MLAFGESVRRLSLSLAVLCGMLAFAADGGQAPSASRPPIIDVHVHALPANAFGPPPIPTCAVNLTFLPRDPRDPYGFADFASCAVPLTSPTTDEEVMRQTLQVMATYNVTAVVSGSIAAVRRWQAAAPPGRVIPALLSNGPVPVSTARTAAMGGTIKVLGELGFQYNGLAPGDPVPESCFALAEEFDLPVGVHVGPGSPGAAYVAMPKYRASLSNPLLYEEALVKHPKLRLYIMHAGWPMGDAMLALLYAHPQVYVDIGVIDWFVPRPEFHSYLKRLVDAGFGKRIMFGSDQMIWPETMRLAIEGVESAAFLTPEQKRDIFHDNAARFLRLPLPLGD